MPPIYFLVLSLTSCFLEQGPFKAELILEKMSMSKDGSNANGLEITTDPITVQPKYSLY